MKKIFLICALLMVMASPSLATDVKSNGSSLTLGGITVTGAAKASDKLICGLSNQVDAIYRHIGTADAPAQWYAIGTYHLGGTKVYGTAQDITALYSIDKQPGSTYNWDDMPADDTASSTWSGSWKVL